MASRQMATKTKQKNAISLLKKDHDTVRKLLSEMEETTTRGVRKREELLARIALEVEVHAAVEEEIFYPAFRECGETRNDEMLFFEAAEEHNLVHVALPALRTTDPATELFSARAKVLKDLIEHHAEEEEREIFPRARQLMSADELHDLGMQLEERKQVLMEHGANGRSRRGPRRDQGRSSSARGNGGWGDVE